METNPKQYAMSSLIAKITSNQLSLDHKYQRAVGQWSNYQKSLLIDSILRGYPIEVITLVHGPRGIMYSIDGNQRLSTIYEFYRDGFRLTRNMKPVKYRRYDEKGKEYFVTFDIAGKRFSKLDPEMKQAIMDYQVEARVISDYEEEDIAEMFLRLNNGTALNAAQKSSINYHETLYEAMKNILKRKFWSYAGVGTREVKKAADRTAVLQSLLALSREQFRDFKQVSLDHFVMQIQEDEPRMVDLFNKIYDVIDVIEKVWNDKIPNCKVTSIAPIIFGGSLFDNEEDLIKYAEWVRDFFTNGYHSSVYSTYCQYSTAGKDMVMGRLKFFTEAAEAIKAGKEPVVEKTIDAE